MLFTIEFREPKLDGTLVEHTPLHISTAAKTFTSDVDGHTFFRESYHPTVIPVEPIVTLKFMDKFIMEFTAVNIPGCVENYDELADFTWVQINSPKNKFTIQLRLKKIPRENAIYCEKANMHAVYAAVGVALHINNIAESSNALDRLLSL